MKEKRALFQNPKEKIDEWRKDGLILRLRFRFEKDEDGKSRLFNPALDRAKRWYRKVKRRLRKTGNGEK